MCLYVSVQRNVTSKLRVLPHMCKKKRDFDKAKEGESMAEYNDACSR